MIIFIQGKYKYKYMEEHKKVECYKGRYENRVMQQRTTDIEATYAKPPM